MASSSSLVLRGGADGESGRRGRKRKLAAEASLKARVEAVDGLREIFVGLPHGLHGRVGGSDGYGIVIYRLCNTLRVVDERFDVVSVGDLVASCNSVVFLLIVILLLSLSVSLIFLSSSFRRVLLQLLDLELELGDPFPLLCRSGDVLARSRFAARGRLIQTVSSGRGWSLLGHRCAG